MGMTLRFICRARRCVQHCTKLINSFKPPIQSFNLSSMYVLLDFSEVATTQFQDAYHPNLQGGYCMQAPIRAAFACSIKACELKQEDLSIPAPDTSVQCSQ